MQVQSNMNKVFLVHGFEGTPNGGWRPWLMAELEQRSVYCCALAMKSPEAPVCQEWTNEIARHVEMNPGDQVYLVGHSLGVPAILRYLEGAVKERIVAGCILVSGPSEKNGNHKIDNFLEEPFDFEKIKQACQQFVVIHGDNDPNVPLDNARTLAHGLKGELVVVENGGHLNGSAGWFELPQCLEALSKLMKL